MSIQEEKWIKSGQTKLIEILQDDQSLPTQGKDILRFFADYLDACAAVIYIRNKDNFLRIANMVLINRPHPKPSTTTMACSVAQLLINVLSSCTTYPTDTSRMARRLARENRGGA